MEAVMASFLMVLAFLVAVKLYGASLQWEASTGKIRQASMLAERKMEEIRARSLTIPGGSTFSAHLDGIIGGSHLPYSDAPIFRFEVTPVDNIHKEVESSGFIPPDGIHSPGSTFYTRPDGSATPYSSDPQGDYQWNATYESYPYSRRMPQSYRLVQVDVRWNSDPKDYVRLISLIGDPILPPRDTTPNPNLNQTLSVVKESGPNNLTGTGASAIYRIEVYANNNSQVQDVSAVWSLHPLNDGTADLFTLDSSGTRVRVSRSSSSKNGTSLRLYPQIRYHGKEARAIGPVISL